MTGDIDETKNKIKAYIVHQVFVEEGKIHNDSLIFKEGYVDSMGFVSLISFLEESFKITIQDSDLIEENFESINAMTNFVINKQN